MKQLFNKWLDNQRFKYEKLYCKHDWTKKQEMINESENIYTHAKQKAINELFVCSKCGEMRIVSFDEIKNNPRG